MSTDHTLTESVSSGTPGPHSATKTAAEVNSSFLHKPFGIIKFWGFGVVRPNDQYYEVVSTAVEGNRLDLVIAHESRQGHTSVISVWDPEGVEPAPENLGQGVAIRSASRLVMDENEATREGNQFRLSTARGEGLWPLKDGPALVLAR